MSLCVLPQTGGIREGIGPGRLCGYGSLKKIEAPKRENFESVNAAKKTQSVRLSIRVFVGIQHQPQINSNHGKCVEVLAIAHYSCISLFPM